MNSMTAVRVGAVLAGMFVLAGCRSSQSATKSPGPDISRGVLDFRILADQSTGEDAAQLAACRAAFAKEGPERSGTVQGYRWFRIKTPEDFFKARDIASQFDRLKGETSLVVERRKEEYFVLAHADGDWVMTHEPGAPEWSVQAANVNRSTHGYAGVEVELDERGGAQLEKLTQAHRGKNLCIFLDDLAVAGGTIMDVIPRKMVIHGAFSPPEAERLAKLLLEGAGRGKPGK